jgi:hypothetical protein
VYGLPYKIPKGKEKDRSPVLWGLSYKNNKMITQITKYDYTDFKRIGIISVSVAGGRK